MNLFEQAVRQQIRFELNGSISIEQLYNSYNKTSSKTALKQYAGQLQQQLKNFVDFDVFNDEAVKSNEQELVETKLAIVKQLYQEIVARENSLKLEADVKAHNAKIDALIARKQDESLEILSVEDLLKMRK